MERSFDAWWNGLTAGRVALATALVAMAVGGFYLVFRFNQVVIIAFAAVIVGTAVRLLVDRLRARGLNRVTGTVLIYAALLGVLALLLGLGLPLLIGQAETLQATAVDAYRAVHGWLASAPNLVLLRVAAALPEELPPLGRLLETAVPAAGNDPTVSPWQTLSDGLWTAFKLAAAFVLAIYWTLEGERVERSAVLLLPLERRESARELLATLQEKVAQFVLGQGVLVVAIFALSLAAYVILGLPNALPLALIAGLMEAIPYVGPILGGVPALIVALTLSPGKAVATLVAIVIIQQIENTLLVPRVMNRAVGVGPMLTFLSIFAFGFLFGVPGALIAVPLAAVLQVLLDRVLDRSTADSAEPAGRGRTSVLRYRVQELNNDIRSWMRKGSGDAAEGAEHLEDEVENLALDLELLLAEKEDEES
jgi:predicted PurR-regulated permease PerM